MLVDDVEPPSSDTQAPESRDRIDFGDRRDDTS
jgi:hypothetical protein